MISALSIFGVYISIKNKVERVPFDIKEAVASTKDAIWEILLPVIILLGFFGGLFTIVETGAIAVVYSLILTMISKVD